MPADHKARCCNWCDQEMSLHSCPAAAGDAPTGTAEDLLERARGLVPAALDAARAATGGVGRGRRAGAGSGRRRVVAGALRAPEHGSGIPRGRPLATRGDGQRKKKGEGPICCCFKNRKFAVMF